ncbi:MAG: UDP-3-O-(3-hydroxymyristoyl)glucosamine N-acyltransferase [Ferruginibacter sp.]
MEFSAAQIALIISGQVEGNADISVASFGKIEEAQAGQLSFLANPKYENYLYSSNASIIIINAGVKIYHDCVIGKNVCIHAGTVIGSDGFGFAPQADGSLKKVPQIGNVIIEDNVEIGANATIDRATIGSTIIRSGAKLDNLLQIAHNVEVGNNSVIAAQSGVSGSTKIGKNVMIGGQVGIVGHLQIADGSKINAQSGVSKSMKQPNTAVTGSPAYDYTAALRSQAIVRNLPEMEKRIKELESLVAGLLSPGK